MPQCADDVYSSIPNSCNKAHIMPAIWDNALPWLEQWYKMDLSYLQVRLSIDRLTGDSCLC